MSDYRPTILNVANYPLPATDYRVQYAISRRHQLRVVFVLPALPDDISDFDVVLLPFGEGVEWRDLGTFARLAVVLWRQRSALEFAHFYSTKLILVGPLLAAAVGVRSVVTVTGFGRVFVENTRRYRLARVVYLAAFRLMARAAQEVLFQNRGDLESTLARLPRLAAKARFIGSGTLEVPSVKRVRNPRLQVLHVARLLPSKGIADFLAVSEAMVGEPIDFTLAGGPSDGHPELLARVQSAADAGVLRYAGRLDGPAMDRTYGEADVLFFPSHGEGMARAMLEAGVRGVCPLAYDIPANRDLVAPGRGFLTAVGDIEAVCDVLRRLAADRQELAANASGYEDHVRRHFGMAAFGRRADEMVARVTGLPPRDDLTTVIRHARREDLHALARVHAAAFPGFFLTTLGPTFLRSYYRLVLDSPGGILLVAEAGTAVTGLVAGFLRQGGVNTAGALHRLRLAAAVLPAVLRRPAIARDVLQRGLGQGEVLADAELASLAVHPAAASSGTGGQLVAAFLQEAWDGGAHAVGLTTDAVDNERVHRFYERLGFAAVRRFTSHAGRQMVVYTVDAESASTGSPPGCL